MTTRKGSGLKGNFSDLAHLIRSLQRIEGNSDCFGTAVLHCDRMDCVWREYCLEESQEPQVKSSKLRKKTLNADSCNGDEREISPPQSLSGQRA